MKMLFPLSEYWAVIKRIVNFPSLVGVKVTRRRFVGDEEGHIDGCAEGWEVGCCVGCEVGCLVGFPAG
jgi:hypothetical protein